MKKVINNKANLILKIKHPISLNLSKIVWKIFVKIKLLLIYPKHNMMLYKLLPKNLDGLYKHLKNPKIGISCGLIDILNHKIYFDLMIIKK